MSMFRNVMVYLGLGPDEEYDDAYLYEDEDEVDGNAGDAFEAPSPAEAGAGFGAAAAGASAVGTVRPLRSVGTAGAAPGTSSFDDGSVTVRPLNAPADSAPSSSEGSSAVGAVTSMGGSVTAVPVRNAKPKSLAPQSFGDAKILADEFKRSTPVIMVLQALDRDLSRRLIDFASGVCYSLGGSMEKLASGVFLLVPKGVEVSAEDRRRIEERGFDR